MNLFRAADMETVCRIPIDEVLLQPATFSRSGRIGDGSIETSIRALRSRKKRVVLDFNILVRDEQLAEFDRSSGGIFEKMDAVRFMDPGVGAWIAERYPKTALQMSLEFGSFNRTAIAKWVDVFGSRLQRVVLSNQIPLQELESITRSLPVETELMACGRVQLFYSPAKLLHPHFQQSEDSRMEMVCASEERPKRLLPVLENRHGTIMFYDQDLYILDMAEEIGRAGIRNLRFELYNKEQYRLLAEHFPSCGWERKLRACWKKETTRGFLRGNRTDLPLERLTNRFLKAGQENRIGTVLESVKNRHVVWELLRDIRLPQNIVLFSPEGKKIDYTLQSAQNLGGAHFSETLAPGYYRIPWLRYVVPGTIITRPDRKVPVGKLHPAAHE